MILAFIYYVYHSIIIFIRRQKSMVWIITTALLVGFIARISLIALTSATAFPIINIVYLSSAYPLLLLFILFILLIPIHSEKQQILSKENK